MKRNNVAKRFGIASLCLATAISAFSGIAASSNNDNVALAEATTTLSVANLVETSTGATAIQDLESEGTYVQGLRISSDVAYEAKFNMLFNKNSQFVFRFPETYDSTVGYYGDFKFHIADATDPTNCFDIVYYVETTKQTGVYVQWKDQKAMPISSNPSGSQYVNSTASTNGDMFYAPGFLSTSDTTAKGTTLGRLSLVWSSGGILGVQLNTMYTSTLTATKSIARFDGSYDSSASKGGFTGGSAMGLPKLSFPNGYTVTVSSDFTKDGVSDHGTDVVFTQIRTNGTTSTTAANQFYFITAGTTYKNQKTAASSGTALTLNSSSTTEFTNNFIKGYDMMKTNAATGKVLLGWKDANEALYPTATAIASADIAAYSPVYLGFDTMNGASVRIDTTGGQSGIRFMSLFNVSEYAALSAAGYIQSKGTLIASADALTQGDFTHANYATEIAAATAVAQVENTKDTFTYTDQNGTYTAYSMALTGITDNTQTYAARGYLVVVYADTTTQYVYTDYDAANNTRSIAEVAYKLQQSTEYQGYTDAQQGIVDGYAASYVVPEE